MSEFEMSMFGEIKFFVGLQINQLKHGTFITQSKYLKQILKNIWNGGFQTDQYTYGDYTQAFKQ